MLISELQSQLEAIKQKHGDLPIRYRDAHYYMEIDADDVNVRSERGGVYEPLSESLMVLIGY